jgi:hypothetical protein
MRGWVLWAVLLGSVGVAARAQVPTTTVQDTVYTASGTPASGSVVVSWNTFTDALGDVIPAGTTTATIGANGVLSLALTPNAGSTPVGNYYTAVFHLSDGTMSKHYWVVPVTVPGGGAAKLNAIENDVLPTTVAMQTVSKTYVDNAIARAQIGGLSLTTSPYVLKTGDSMTGPLVLPGDPVSPLQAADKNYVDENVAALTGGLGQVVHTLPSAAQTVSQPSGTELGVNILNGKLYANEFVTGDGNNGIANAVNSADCASGCGVVVDPNYSSTEPVTLGTMANGMVVEDERGGADVRTAVNPLANNTTFSAARNVTQINTMTQQELDALRPGTQAIGAAAEQLTTVAETGGLNLFPAEIETPPNFKSTYGVLTLTGNYNTQGQHIQLNSDINCYGVGDCLAGGQFITSSGGYRDNSDEGTHPYDLQVVEDFHVFGGTCTTGCTTGSTQLMVNATTSSGTQGDGRFLMDTAPGKVIQTGTIVGGGKSVFGTAEFSGTSFPVSVFLQTAQTVTSQATNVAPGVVSVPIATSGVPTGFATNTAALPATSGVACVADADTSSVFPNYEMAPYTVVDGTHLQMTLNKPHLTGAVIAVGGLCGYGLDQTVDDVGGVQQIFPVVGSTSATQLYYADALTPSIGGTGGAAATSGYLNASIQVASIARSGNVVTVTAANNFSQDVNGLTMTVAGVADSSYDGSFQVTTTGPNTLTYASTGADSTSSGGTVSLLTGGYNLYPMAEVLSVYDATNHSVNGAFTLAPNTVAWAAGDTVVEPHYYQQNTAADTELVSQYVPRPTQYVQAGKEYTGNVTAGLRGWQVTNGNPANYYLSGGGTHNLPDDAYVVAGPWRNDFEVDAGSQSLLYVHCRFVGCDRWDSGYNLFQLDSAVGTDLASYAPQSSTVSWNMRGTSYSFSPTAFTAGTIDAGSVNASSIVQTCQTSGGSLCKPIFNNPNGSLEVDFNAASAGLAYAQFNNQAYAWGFGIFGGQTFVLRDAYNGNEPVQIQPRAANSSMVITPSAVSFGAPVVTQHNTLDDGSGNATVQGSLSAGSYKGPATAPTGSCSANGVWVFSQDGHATFCASGTWVTKI